MNTLTLILFAVVICSTSTERNYEPLGIPRYELNAADDYVKDTTQPYGYFYLPLPTTIKLPSMDDWIKCFTEKYAGKICIWNDDGWGYWWDDENGERHEIWTKWD